MTDLSTAHSRHPTCTCSVSYLGLFLVYRGTYPPIPLQHLFSPWFCSLLSLSSLTPVLLPFARRPLKYTSLIKRQYVWLSNKRTAPSHMPSCVCRVHTLSVSHCIFQLVHRLHSLCSSSLSFSPYSSSLLLFRPCSQSPRSHLFLFKFPAVEGRRRRRKRRSPARNNEEVLRARQSKAAEIEERRRRSHRSGVGTDDEWEDDGERDGRTVGWHHTVEVDKYCQVRVTNVGNILVI